MTTDTTARGVPFYGIAAVALAGVALVLQFGTTLNHDAAWHFETAFMWLAGGEIGKDVVDFNPPMTLWLSSLPAIVVNMTGLSPCVVFKAFVFLLMFLSLGLSVRIFTAAGYGLRSRCIFAVCFAAIMLIYPEYHFGQREHIAVALVLPYLVLSAYPEVEAARTRFAILIGMLAAVGIGFKPYFVFIPVFVELALMIHMRSWKHVFRPVCWAIIGTSVLYVGAVWLVAPKYLTDVLPKAFWSYGAFEAPGQPIGFIVKGIVAMVAAGLGFCFKNDRRVPLVFWTIVAAAFAFGFAAYLQNKQWTYQWMPYMLLAMLSLSVFAMTPPGSGRRPVYDLIASAGMVWVSLMVALPYFLGQWKTPPEAGMTNTRTRVAMLTEVFSGHAGVGGYVYGFTTSPRDLHPAVLESSTKWADSAGLLIYTPSLLMAGPGQLVDEHVEEVERQERMIVRNLVERQPKVVVVQLKGRLAIPDEAESFISYFSKYSDFREFWMDYEPKEMIGSFQIWLRR